MKRREGEGRKVSEVARGKWGGGGRVVRKGVRRFGRGWGGGCGERFSLR